MKSQTQKTSIAKTSNSILSKEIRPTEPPIISTYSIHRNNTFIRQLALKTVNYMALEENEKQTFLQDVKELMDPLDFIPDAEDFLASPDLTNTLALLVEGKKFTGNAALFRQLLIEKISHQEAYSLVDHINQIDIALSQATIEDVDKSPTVFLKSFIAQRLFSELHELAASDISLL